MTDHRVDSGRRGPCLVCLKRLEDEAAKRPVKAAKVEQGRLF